MIRGVPYALMIVASPGTVYAGGASDSIVATARQTWVGDTTLHGWASSLDWVRTLSDGRSASVGLDWVQLGPFTRMLAQLGGNIPLTPRVGLMGQLRAGEADVAGDRYFHGELTTQLSYSTSVQTFLSVQQRAITAGSLRGDLLGVSATYLPTPTVSLSATTLATVAGNLGTRASSLRIDYVKRIHLLAGVSIGESQPGIYNAPLASPGRQLQYYAGFGSSIRWVSLTLILDRLHSAEVDQYDAMLIASTPLP